MLLCREEMACFITVLYFHAPFSRFFSLRKLLLPSVFAGCESNLTHVCFSWQDWQNCPEGSWLLEYPVTVVQFLTFLYHNVDQFSAVSCSQDFIEHLVAVAFPEVKQIRITSRDDSSLKVRHCLRFFGLSFGIP